LNKPLLLSTLLITCALINGASAQPKQQKPAPKPNPPVKFSADAHLTYRIGNSLTWDSQPRSIQLIAAQRKIEHVQGYHINCGKSLKRIWNNQKEVCVQVVNPFGTLDVALPNHDWNAVTFQPHPGADSTLATDTDCILKLIKLTQSKGRNRKTVFYIYAAWPGKKHGPYHEIWTKPTPDKDETRTIQTRDYFDHLFKRVRAKAAPETSIAMIPAGHVVYELDKLAREGELPGCASAHDLFRDVVHLNHVGRYAAGVTTFATIFKQDPKGLTCPPKAYGGGKDLNDKLYEAIHASVWKVLAERKAQTGLKTR